MNPQSRKWQLTINNPAEHGLSHDAIAERLDKLTYEYVCLADEIAPQTQTPHTHVFIYSASPKKFSTLKALFPEAHIERAKGSVAQNRDYVAKTGKWKDDPKGDTSIEGTFEEFGEMPQERTPQDKKEALLRMVQAGMTASEIINTDSDYIYRIKNIVELRQQELAERYMNELRQLHVTYIYGSTGTGKTYGIFQQHEAKDICRITHYRDSGSNFDAYDGHKILVFEEFASQIEIEAMLNYLDQYPLMLPARYADRVACYTEVYITSNLPLSEQYPYIAKTRREVWAAFLRRIDRVVEHKSDGTIIEKGTGAQNG